MVQSAEGQTVGGQWEGRAGAGEAMEEGRRRYITASTQVRSCRLRPNQRPNHPDLPTRLAGMGTPVPWMLTPT